MKKILGFPKNIVDFFRDTIAELGHVEWLSRNKTLTYTFFIVLFLIMGAISILLIDKLFLGVKDLLIPA